MIFLIPKVYPPKIKSSFSLPLAPSALQALVLSGGNSVLHIIYIAVITPNQFYSWYEMSDAELLVDPREEN